MIAHCSMIKKQIHMIHRRFLFVGVINHDFCAGKKIPQDDNLQRLLLYACADHVLQKVENPQ